MQGAPDKWETAFVYIEMLPDGEFWHHLIRIKNNKFVWNARVYEG
jgi:hypothetical protein